MLKNYLAIACRNLYHRKSFTVINITGLSIGIAAFFIILLYVKYELSYENFQTRADQIYRITSDNRVGVPAGLATTIANQSPIIKNTVRFFSRRLVVKIDDTKFYEDIHFVDPSIFQIFSFPLLSGDPNNALRHPNSLVISETIATKYFGNSDPLGKTIRVDRGSNNTYQITGVIKDLPSNTHIQADILASFSTLNESFTWALDNSQGTTRTYILTSPHHSESSLSEALIQVSKTLPQWKDFHFQIQPLRKIHLYSNLSGDFQANGSIYQVYIFSVSAILLLGISCINFVNLTLANSIKRGKEIGIRKVAGANRHQIRLQFLGESILICSIATIFSIGIVEFILPIFNTFFEVPLVFNFTQNLLWGATVIAIPLMVGCLSGSYPAFYISKLQPNNVLKGNLSPNFGNKRFREALVVFQFVISISLSVSAFVIKDQVHFMSQKELGFDKEQMISLKILRGRWTRRFEVVKSELLENPHITSVTAHHRLPGQYIDTREISSSGGSDTWQLWGFSVDHNFIPHFGMELIAGRNFSPDFQTDLKDACIINEAALHIAGFKSPEEAIGKTPNFVNNGKPFDRKIVGVVKNFHFQSLHHKIEPLFLYASPIMAGTSGGYVTIKTQADQLDNVIPFLKEKWEKLTPNYPFEYVFIDDAFGRMYHREERIGSLLQAISLLTVFVACLGLWALVSLATERRTKEIGVRKVLGATNKNIIVLLSSDFLKPVIVAMLVACPIAYYWLNHWLQSFAYRIDLSLYPFLVCSGLTLSIAFLAVLYQSLHVSNQNPIESLRTE